MAGCLYRIVYEVLGDRTVRPIEIFPITGFRIERRMPWREPMSKSRNSSRTKTKARTRTDAKAKTSRPARGDYPALVAWAEERLGPERRWEDLALAAPVRGRPAKGRKPLGLEARTVKLPKVVWTELRAAAARHGVTVNGVLIALGHELVCRSALDATIERLIEERLLVPSRSP